MWHLSSSPLSPQAQLRFNYVSYSQTSLKTDQNQIDSTSVTPCPTLWDGSQLQTQSLPSVIPMWQAPGLSFQSPLPLPFIKETHTHSCAFGQLPGNPYKAPTFISTLHCKFPKTQVKDERCNGKLMALEKLFLTQDYSSFGFLVWGGRVIHLISSIFLLLLQSTF